MRFVVAVAVVLVCGCGPRQATETPEQANRRVVEMAIGPVTQAEWDQVSHDAAGGVRHVQASEIINLRADAMRQDINAIAKQGNAEMEKESAETQQRIKAAAGQK